MDPLLALGDRRLEVEPGEVVSTTLKVRNPGSLVEQYHLDVVGPAAAWARVAPAEVSVYPGTDAEVTVYFQPPRAPGTPAGVVPFGVRCRSHEDADATVVEEGDLVVGAVLDVALELTPTTTRGRWSGRYGLVLHNRGTGTARVRLAPKDPAERLAFALAPDIVDAPAGGEAKAALKVRARSPFLRGSPQQHRFQVTGERLLAGTASASTPLATEGTFEQRPVLSKLVAAGGAAGVVAVVAAVVLSLGGGGGDEDPTSLAELPPPAPTVSTVAAVGSTAVQIDWVPNPNVTGYVVQQVDPASAQGVPKVVQEQKVDGVLARFTWDELAPATNYCLQLAAVNGAGPGPASKPLCAETPGKAPFPPPTGLTVTPIEGQASVEMAWQAADPAARHLVLVDNQAKVEVVGTSTQLDVNPGTHCFSVLGRTAGGEDTAPSNQVCLPVSPPPTPGTVPGGGASTTAGGTPGGPTTAATGGTGGATTAPPATTGAAGLPTTTTVVAAVPVKPGWMALVESFPVDDYKATEPLARAQSRRAELEAKGAQVSLAPSESLQLQGVRSWVIYADGFDQRSQADALCKGLADQGLLGKQSCVTVEKGVPITTTTTTAAPKGSTATTAAATPTAPAPTSAAGATTTR